MALEQYQNILYTTINFFSLLAVILSIVLLFKIFKDKKVSPIKKVLKVFFSFLSIGLLFSLIAEISWDILSSQGFSPELGFPDIMWVLSYLLLFFAFTYFSVYLYKKNRRIVTGLAITSILAIFSGFIVFFITYNYITGFEIGNSYLELFLNYFYPIVSLLIFISTISIYLFFNKLKNFGLPFLHLAVAYFFNFWGDILYSYYSWNDIYGWYGVISDSCFAISYLLIAIAFILFLKNWVSKKENKKIKRKLERKKQNQKNQKQR